MKRIIVISLALALSLGVYAQTSGIGIGVKLGTVVDFTAKFWMSEKAAFDLSAGLDYGTYGGLHFSADYLLHNWSFDVAQDIMKVYFGPGIGLGGHFGTYYGAYSAFRVTARAPGGVGYYFHGFPLEAFAEFVPSVDFIGPYGLNFRWNSYVGARWYF